MNYLAHLIIAEITGTSRVGSFLGDFVKGPMHQIPINAAYLQGVFLHRKVDVFTDAHPVVARSRARISPYRRRFAGIIIDVAYDFYLANQWQDYSNMPLSKFVAQFYAELAHSKQELPDNAQAIVDFMISGNWLENYQYVEGVNFALNGISRRYRRRYSRENPLETSVDEILANFDSLSLDFAEFFPELIDHAISLVGKD